MMPAEPTANAGRGGDAMDLEAKLDLVLKQQQELLDRQAIRDCLTRYCRGMDRMDDEITLSAYHPDAIDDHGGIAAGPGPFVDWANETHRQHSSLMQHMLTNHSCEIDGDTAHAETYWLAVARHKDGQSVTLSGGRYLDRLEKRDGRWAIAARKCLVEWCGTPRMEPMPEANRKAMSLAGEPRRDRQDPSYERPLTIDPARVSAGAALV
jgi:hypothetical protein